MYILRVFKLRVRHHQILLDKAKVLARPACIVLEAKKIFYKKNLLLIETFSPCSIENLRYALCVLEWGIILQSATKLLGHLHGFTVKERVWTPLPPNSHPPPPSPTTSSLFFAPARPWFCLMAYFVSDWSYYTRVQVLIYLLTNELLPFWNYQSSGLDT